MTLTHLKYLKIIGVVILVILVIGILFLIFKPDGLESPLDSFQLCFFKNPSYDKMLDNLVSTENPYLSNYNRSGDILWPLNKYKFMCQNWPTSFKWDFKIKEDIIANTINAPLNSSIIDCGAHIGDGAIPIAHTLLLLDRPDITVYAIDPSLEKCQFIETIADKNNLTNIKVINVGLSDKNETLAIEKRLLWGGSGSTEWSDLNNNDTNSKFVTLDSLNIPNICAIHLDVEGFEYKAILGGENTIKRYKPYLSLEINREIDLNLSKFDKILSKYGYEMKYKIAQNYIFTSNTIR